MRTIILTTKTEEEDTQDSSGGLLIEELLGDDFKEKISKSRPSKSKPRDKNK